MRLRRGQSVHPADPPLRLVGVATGRAVDAMTTTAPRTSTTGSAASAPALNGISHLGLAVADLDATIDFWCRVMGFDLVVQGEEASMVWHRSALIAIGLTAHDGSVVGPFDEHHVGLDHLALAVADVPTLQNWATRFAALSVPHSPITETDAGHHLNVRAPDNLAIEMFVLKAEFAGAVLGVEVGDGSARTHR